MGGSGAVVDALVRAVTKTGTGRVFLNAHVQNIVVEGGRAVGVRMRRGGHVVKARRAVISNASVWDTTKLLPEGTLPQETVDAKVIRQQQPRGPSPTSPSPPPLFNPVSSYRSR